MTDDRPDRAYEPLSRRRRVLTSQRRDQYRFEAHQQREYDPYWSSQPAIPLDALSALCAALDAFAVHVPPGHQARRAALGLLAAVQHLARPCSTCGSRPGQMCLTVTGKQASDPHAARTRADFPRGGS